MALFWAYVLWAVISGTGLTRIVPFDGGTWPTFTFDHGYVLVWDDPQGAIIDSGAITLYGPDGHRLYSTALTTPDGVPAIAVAAAIDAHGAVAIVYQDHAKPHSRAGIAMLDEAGKAASFLVTDPFVPGFICFSDDGSIWAAGSASASPTADFLTVRKYSRGGDETGAFLPLSEVSSPEVAVLRPPFSQFTGGWKMHATKDRIGILADAPSIRRWLELDPTGKQLGSWDIEDRDLPVGAFTSNGVLYGQVGGPGHTLDLVFLDKSTGKWIKTGGTIDGILLAADGDDLVFQMRTGPGHLLVWVRMRAQWASAHK